MPQYNDAYDPLIHKFLDEALEAALPAALKYAHWRAKKFYWLGGKINPEALVCEAIARAYGIGTNGTYRNWNRAKCPDLSIFLMGIIRSITSHSAEHEKIFHSESLFYDDGSLKEDKLLELDDEATGLSSPKTPEEEMIESENIQYLIDEIDRISNEDDDLGLVILCIQDGHSKPRDIATQTGLEINQVNNLLKRLRRKLNNFNPKLKKQSSKERREEWV